MHLSQICHFYFRLGLNYADILLFLAQIHGICISMRTLKRNLRAQGLFRRRFHTDLLTVALFIEEQVSNSGHQQGYRWMHLRCIQQGMTVSRDTVQVLMQILDPIGVELRLKRRLRRREYFARGPDYLWHIDSYDKLKKFGLCINGCIDGFARQIIWVIVYKTASNPRVVAGYYMDAVAARKGCPTRMRGDMGTENGHVAQMQNFMSGKESFIYGRSTSNQRIEMFWSFLRKQCCQFWIDMLSSLQDNGHFTGDFVDINLIQFCFMNILQVINL